MLHMPSRQTADFGQCRPPSKHPLLSDVSISCKCFSKTSRLFPHIRRIHMVENWYNFLFFFSTGLHDLIKLIQTPLWMSIVFGKNCRELNQIPNLWETKIEKHTPKKRQSHAQNSIYVVLQFAYVQGVVGISLLSGKNTEYDLAAIIFSHIYSTTTPPY